MSSGRRIERGLERALFASRWLMLPMYVGLVLVLGMLAVVFARELLAYLPRTPTLGAEDAILVTLTLIDVTLVANLVLIVLVSSYDNFVSRLDVGEGEERPSWIGSVDFSGLKIKLIGSIVAISGIHLLKRFMEIGTAPLGAEGGRELLWLTVIHFVFVVSAVLLALMDWLGARSGGKRGPPPGS